MQDSKHNYLSEIEALREELHDAQCEAANAHKLRKECTDLCSILTVRLQELAEFLDSLLRQKDMLSVLGQDRRRAMRKAVDKSLDLSKSLNNMSMSLAANTTIGGGRLSLSDTNSFMHQLSFLSADLLLSDNDKENNEPNATTDCCGGGDEAKEERGEMIEALRSEVKYLRNELEKTNATTSSVAVAKKERKSLPAAANHHQQQRACLAQSESEAWSEPDRKVSIARIGLDESSISRSPKKYNMTGGGGGTTTTATTTSNTSSELESNGGGATKLSRKNSNAKYQARIAEVELKLSQRDNDILKQQCQLVESDNRLKTERLRVFEVTKELDGIRELNAMLEVDIATFKGRVEQQTERLSELAATLVAKEERIDALTAARDASDVDLRVATMKLEALQAELLETRQAHGNELDKCMSEHSVAIETMKRTLIDRHRAELERDWVSRVQHEDVRRQADMAARNVTDAQATIDFMRENEAELSAQIIDGEKGVRALRKQLDDAAMQTSKAVLERTKIMAEKLGIEKQCVELQQLLDATQGERADLVVRMAQLEKINATLQNRLVSNGASTTAAAAATATSSGMQYQLSRSASHGSGGHYYQPQQLQQRGAGHSSGGYTSDEVVKERLQNSSPDLGIESDAGRTSNSDGGGGGGSRVVAGVRRAIAEGQFELGASMSNVFIEDEEESKYYL